MLCSKGPTSAITGTSNWQVIYSCTIPANTLSAGQAIRLTASLSSGGSAGLDWGLFLNGVNVIDEGFPQNQGTVYNVLIFDTGATTGEVGGIMPGGAAPWIAPASVAISGLDWASTQTLDIEFILGGTATGRTFLVEVVN